MGVCGRLSCPPAPRRRPSSVLACGAPRREISRQAGVCGLEAMLARTGRVWPEDEPILNLEIHCGQSLERTVPQEEYIRDDDRPMLDVWIPLPVTSLAELEGLTIAVRPEDLECYDAECTFSYYETADLRDVVVRFPQLRDGALRVLISGRTRDPNHYDGSKADANVTIDTWMVL
jgi:hypothetical protein